MMTINLHTIGQSSNALLTYYTTFLVLFAGILQYSFGTTLSRNQGTYCMPLKMTPFYRFP